VELSQLVDVIRRQWKVAAAALLVVLALGMAVAFVPPKRYTATATVLAQPNLEGVEFVQVQVVEFLLPSLGRQVESDRLRSFAATSLPPEAEGVSYDIKAETDPGTGVLDIKVSTVRRAAAAPIANELAAQLVERQPAARLLVVSVLDPASPPREPAPPTPTTILMATVVLGLITAIFAALAANALRRRVQGAEEVRRRFGTSVLGEIPRLRQLKTLEGSPSSILHDNSNPAATEAFHRLRTNMELALLTEGAEAVTVTSVGPGDGKSTVAATLGWSLASAGHRVILVDADLRRPTLHAKLGEPFGPGLCAWVGESAPPPSSTALDELTFVPAGTPERHPAEVITVALPKLLSELERPGRLVMVDAPPLEGVAETNLIAAMTRAVILVVDARRHNAQAVEHAMYRLHEAGTRVVGVVINRAKLSKAERQISEYYGTRDNRPPVKPKRAPVT
jgi:capsular exopolysaccharide synthesis family protein